MLVEFVADGDRLIAPPRRFGHLPKRGSIIIGDDRRQYKVVTGAARYEYRVLVPGTQGVVASLRVQGVE